MVDALLLWRQAVRELRGQRARFAFFAACLAIGVAATLAVDGLAASLERAIRTQSRELLAADLEVRSNQALTPETQAALAEVAERFSLRLAEVSELVTMSARARPRERADGAMSQLVELKAVGSGYPFYGELETDPRAPLAELLARDGAVVAQDLLLRLELEIGDRLRVGARELTIRARLVREPDSIVGALSLGPRVLISTESLVGTELIGLGSRVERRILLALPAGVPAADAPALLAIRDALRLAIPEPRVRIQSYQDAQPSLRRGLRRLEGFLGLVALLSLLVAGVGVAQSVHAWIRSRLEELAVLRCLGMRPLELFVLGLLQTVLLSVGGITLGVLLGTAALFGVPAFLPDPALADTIDPIQPMAALRAAGLGLFVALLFALPAIAQTLRVPPALVFRREAEPLPGSRLLALASIGMATLGIVLAAAWQSGSSELTLQFSTAVAITGVALYGAARLLVYCLGRLPRDRVAVRPWARHGLAAGARPGAATLASTAALGLSVLVLTAMTLLTASLRQELDDELPRQAPSAFFVDVQTDQWPQLRALLEEQDADNIHSAPVVTARLLAIDGTPVAELAARRDRSERWALTREQRLTYLDALPDDNRLVERLPIEPGAAVRSSGTSAEETSLWRDPARFELSVEEEHARELGLAVGTEVRFEVQGVEVELVVSSLRSVDWEGFGLNFFMVVEPGPLDLAPQTVLATARVPEASEQRVQDRVVAAFPNVTMLRLRPILERLTEVLSRLAAAVGALGAFTVLAALLILVGTILVDGPRRAQEVALLRTLGMTRAGVLAAFAVEYSLLGALATLVGCGGGLAASYWVARQALEIEWRWNPGLLAAVATGAFALTLAAGLLASLGPLRRPPIAVLHEE